MSGLSGSDPTGRYGSGFYPGEGTGGVYDKRVVLDMADKIHMLSPTDAPFYVLLGQLAKVNAKQPRFEWMEDEYFVMRHFTAEYHFITDEAADVLCWLQLKSPSDAQAFEASPYQPTAVGTILERAAAYIGEDVAGTAMTDVNCNLLKIVKVGGTSGNDTMYVIPEKFGVNNVGKWRTIDPTDTVAGNGTDPISGHILMLGQDTAGGDASWTPSMADSWSDYGINIDEAIIIDDTLTATMWVDPGTDYALDASATFDVYVTAYTPMLLQKGHYEGSKLTEESRKGVRTDWNQTQIMKTPWSITNTAIATQYVGGDELARVRNRGLIKHKIDIEKILFTNGERDTWTGESPKRSTRGLGVGVSGSGTTNAGEQDIGFIRTYNVDRLNLAATTHANNSLRVRPDLNNFYGDLTDACEMIFEDQVQGKASKTMFVSQKWLGAFTRYSGLMGGINDGGSGNTMTQGWSMQYLPGSDATAGIAIRRFQSPFGVLNVIPTPTLRGEYENHAVILDMAQMELKPLPGRDTKVISGAQDNDEDGLAEYAITELGLKMMYEQTCGTLMLTADVT